MEREGERAWERRKVEREHKRKEWRKCGLKEGGRRESIEEKKGGHKRKAG